jgi:bifunctional DNA-binding transcriptional regulator/antitoxin component of YhaV-PrlF toxin-antitoxin module
MDKISKVADMEILTQMGKGGRITLPARMRKALQLDTGDAIVLRLEEHVVQVIPLRQAVWLAQEKVKQYVPAGTSLVEELIRARRQEAANE